VAKDVFLHNIVPSLVRMVADNSLPHSEITHLITLLGNLAHNEPGYVIKQGGLTVCIDWSLRMLREKKINRAYLDQIYCFFELMSYKIKSVPTNYNFVNFSTKLEQPNI
jgi:hypothetical protein